MVRGQCGDYARHFISFVPKHVVDMATQIVKIQSPKLDSAISLKSMQFMFIKLSNWLEGSMERICVPFNYYFCRTISSCYGNKIMKIPYLNLSLA